MINNILELSVNILTQTAFKKCLTLESFICLDYTSSSISTDSPDGEINYNIQTTRLKPLNSYFISCIPDMGHMAVSKLHNTHMVQHLGNDLIGKAGIISLENLKLSGAVNQETQTIDGKDLLMENIFITQSKLQLGFTCINPELFYIGSNKYNCTHNTVWIAKDTVEAIFTSRGILSSHHYLNFQVESKLHFMKGQVFQLIEDSSDLDHYTPTNATSFEIIMNEFHALPVHQKAGLSIGMGFGLVLFLCSTYCCIRWSNCRGLVQRCAFPCCPADSGNPPANQNVASDADDTQTSFQQNSEDLSRRAFDLIAERVQSLRNSNIL